MLDVAALAVLDAELERNVRQLFELGTGHFQFAASLGSTHWRQRVSRFYYACYAVSRSLRLHVDGVYSTDVKDHEKVGEVPNDFPNKERYKNDLRNLREDRNLCDYDHTATESELAFSPVDAEQLAQDLINDAKNYLKNRGLRL